MDRGVPRPELGEDEASVAGAASFSNCNVGTEIVSVSFTDGFLVDPSIKSMISAAVRGTEASSGAK
jgi:hypothetical protein